MLAGSRAPSPARMAMTPVGSTATPEVLMARNRTIALVATPGRRLSFSSSCMARTPKGVAAFPRPSTLAAMFMIIAPIAGWSGGTSGNRRTITGRMNRARASSPPADSTIFMRPRKSVMAPTSPMASSTADLAPSSAALPTAGIRSCATNRTVAGPSGRERPVRATLPLSGGGASTVTAVSPTLTSSGSPARVGGGATTVTAPPDSGASASGATSPPARNDRKTSA